MKKIEISNISVSLKHFGGFLNTFVSKPGTLSNILVQISIISVDISTILVHIANILVEISNILVEIFRI